MTDDQHMQKAREIGIAIAQYAANLTVGDAIDHQKVVAPIATALSEAYRSGVEAERERCAEIVKDELRKLPGRSRATAIRKA